MMNNDVSLKKTPVGEHIARYPNRRLSNAFWLLVAEWMLAGMVFLGALSCLSSLQIGVFSPLSLWWEKDASLFVASTGFAFFLAQVICWLKGHYTRRLPFWFELQEYLHVMLFCALLHGTFVFFVSEFVAKWFLLCFWSGVLILTPLVRYSVKTVLLNLGLWQRSTVIVGVGQTAIDAAYALSSEKKLGFEVCAFIQLDCITGECLKSISLKHQIIPVCQVGASTLIESLNALNCPHVVLALEVEELQSHQIVLQKLVLRYPNINIIPPVMGFPLFGLEVKSFFSHDILMLRVRNNLAQRPLVLAKRVFDFFSACFLLLMLSPLFLFVALKVKTGAGGAVFFGHERVGRNGERFKCYKFRTMVPNGDEVLKKLLETDPVARAEWEKDFKLKNDPRVTPIGAFLRKTSLDELPQLWNVVKGEMSLVGPRPIVEAELERYGDKVDYYLEARPGITGLWQVSGRSDTNYDERVNLDAWYVKNWNLWYDVAILCKTVSTVLLGKGAY